MTEELRVGSDDDGERLDRFLAARLEGPTRSQIKRAIDEGAALIDGAAGRAGQRLRAGQVVAFTALPPPTTTVEAEAIELDIVYEDAQVVVVNKAAGMVVHPAAGHARGTLVAALLAHCGLECNGVGVGTGAGAGAGGVNLRPGIVHRLDKDTTGLLVVAKDLASHEHLARQFKAHTVGRRYLALVRGVPSATGVLRTGYGRHPHHRIKFSSTHGGKRVAVTHYRVLERFAEAAAFVACELETGRTHQVRVHLSDIGHAVLGDELYGGRPRDPRLTPALRHLARQALHAARLAFDHPVTGQRIDLEAQPPEDFMAALGELRRLG